MASRNSFNAGYGWSAIVRSTISPCSLSTMTSQALDLVAIHGSHPAQEGGVLIEPKLGRIGTGTARRARLSKNRRYDFTALRQIHLRVSRLEAAFHRSCGSRVRKVLLLQSPNQT